MPTPTKGTRLGGSPAHQRLMLANLASDLFEYRKITTTQAKAKRLRPLAERLVTTAKKNDLAARRRVARVVKDQTVLHELFTEIAPGYAGRHGGYTRITKLGPRKGDNAPMVVIELVEPLAEQTVAEATAATKRAASTVEPTEDASKTDTASVVDDVEAEVASESAESKGTSEESDGSKDA